MEKDQKQSLESFFRGRLLYDAFLKDFVSFKVGGPADVIAFPENQEDLIMLLHFIREEKTPFFVLGEGTNLVVRDSGFRGVVIKLSSGFETMGLEEEGEGKVYVKAQAGVRLSRILDFALQNSLSGLEFSSGIPGSIGGALVMNAGAYGGEIKDVVFSVGILTPDCSIKDIGRQELQFSYRKLNLPPDSIIMEARFELSPGNQEALGELIKEILNKRKKNQPLDFPSAGSVFKNPPGFYAAQLIDDLGLKGYQIGGAVVSERHANFIVNRG
ncbi:MAG: UDP-N-acetylmuramate dehydrogenase, partial [Proteobacteria bacterium]|nr:UDP-N-acetylmuramate dehydrogenase [Pseudomonadota bacterium]